MKPFKTPIVSVDWLKDHINDPNIVVLEAQLGDPSEKHLPNTNLFDLKVFSDSTSKFPNTFPIATYFEEKVRELGINNDSIIIIYDHKGIYNSPRAWFLFRAMGHQNVYVLNGGFPAWENADLEYTERYGEIKKKGDFKAKFKKNLVISFNDVMENINTCQFQVVDARSEARFKGTAPEPRPELQSGSIPNSKNVPYTTVLSGNKLKPIEELKIVFDEVRSDNIPLVFSCGSGITACIILLAYETTFPGEYAIYDGSWTEWATLQNLTTNE